MKSLKHPRKTKSATSTAPLLICTDFDGTLAEEERRPIAPAFFDWLENTRKKRRVTWVINTGRQWEDLAEALHNRNAPQWPDWAILVERSIYRVRSKKAVSFKKWNDRCEKTHRKLFRQTRPLFAKMRAELSLMKGIFIDEEDLGSPWRVITDSEKIGDRVSKLIERHLPAEPLLIAMRNSYFFRFAHRDFHKGSCLTALCSRIGIGAEHCFAAGDHYNDLPMLRRKHARHLACPSNAVAAVKRQLVAQRGYIARKPVAFGVVEALEHFFPA
ncbi:MAG: HAD-IIB family hydrolase [bacterium]